MAVAIATLTGISVLAHFVRFKLLDGRQHAVYMPFDINSEHSLGTYYQGIMLLVAALLLMTIALLPRQSHEPRARWWAVLSAMFAMLSIDELCEMHENVGYAVEKVLHPHGYFRFGWVIPAILFVGVFGAIYLRFLFQLPPRTRLRFIVAGAIYVGGAVGCEMISGKYADAHGEDNITYHLLSDVEECGEMAGIGLFIFALSIHLAEKRAQVSISFEASPQSDAADGDSGSTSPYRKVA